jgi:S1-C subfamily serine protease
MKRRAWSLFIALILAPDATRAETVAEVFRKVAGSVVVIHASEGAEGAEDSEIGSGVLIAPDRVLTAAHVVQVANRIVVDVGDQSIAARVVASEPSADVALLELQQAATGAPVATLGDSSAVQVGDQVLVVGAPLGMSRTLSVGHISGRRAARKLFGGFTGAEMLQTDASINPGNSGGPMFDMNGNVVGIVSHIIFQEAGAGGLGFVVTSNLAKDLVLSGQRMWSGMETYALEGDLARVFQLPQARGLLVQRVADGSPAARIGLLAGTKKATIGGESFFVGGDIILAVQGIDVSEADAAARIHEAVQERASTTPISVMVLRGGRQIELELR